MLKAVELNREVTIAQFQEELDRLRACVSQRDSLEKELLAHKTDKVMTLVHNDAHSPRKVTCSFVIYMLMCL